MPQTVFKFNGLALIVQAYRGTRGRFVSLAMVCCKNNTYLCYSYECVCFTQLIASLSLLFNSWWVIDG